MKHLLVTPAFQSFEISVLSRDLAILLLSVSLGGLWKIYTQHIPQKTKCNTALSIYVLLSTYMISLLWNKIWNSDHSSCDEYLSHQ